MLRTKNKKGVSPLIATVLIIGFTIVLAALVITWGTKLFKGTVSDTETTSQFSLACTTGLNLDKPLVVDNFPAGVVQPPFSRDLMLKSLDQDRPITDFTFVVYDTAGKATVANASTGVVPLDGAAGAADNNPSAKQLGFAVPKRYRLYVNSTSGVGVVGTAGNLLSKIEVYPIFNIGGVTKACESPVVVSYGSV